MKNEKSLIFSEPRIEAISSVRRNFSVCSSKLSVSMFILPIGEPTVLAFMPAESSCFFSSFASAAVWSEMLFAPILRISMPSSRQLTLTRDYFSVKPVSQKRGCLSLQKVACLIGKGIDQISVFHEFPSFRMIRKVLYDRCRR